MSKLKCVHVTTQEEWDEVIRDVRSTYYNSFSTYPDIAISFHDGCHCSVKWYKDNGHDVISFEEWDQYYRSKSKEGIKKKTIDIIGKVLPYKPEITKEIFNNLLELLKKNGLREIGSSMNYRGFTLHGGLRIKSFTFNTLVWNSHCSSEEITLSDIYSFYETTAKDPNVLSFPFNIGDIIRCDKLANWCSSAAELYPLGICDREEVKITKILDKKSDFIPFAAIYQGDEYGFSYNSLNKYSLVEKTLSDSVTSTPILSSTKPLLIKVPKI